MNNQAYIQWEQQQLEPDYSLAHQGGRPRTKGGTNLWDEFKRMQDYNDAMRREEEEMLQNIFEPE